MKIKLVATILFVLFFLSSLFAQNITISGYVEDAKTGERLIGANIFEIDLKVGSSTNNYGFFSLVLPASKKEINLTISYIGYTTKSLLVRSKNDSLLQVLLEPTAYRTDEVIVEANAAEQQLKSTQMSNINIPIKEIELVPALLGEVDILKVLQLLPGIQSGNEGSSGFYVRGGSPDQNLILLDGTPVYNASHLFGFFSVFNPDAIKNVNLIKGGFPARFGGRLSSILEINMKEGNNKEFQGSASIGIISSKVTLEGPILTDKTSYIISGRRTYIDAIMRPFMDSENNGGYFFYDLNAKINHIFSLNDRLYLSAYFGDDDFYAKSGNAFGNYESNDEFDLAWGNFTSVIRWNHIFSNNLFSNISANYSRFRFLTQATNSEKENGKTTQSNKIEYNSGINDLSLGIDFDYTPSSSHYIRFGSSFVNHTFNPGIFEFKSSQIIDTTISSTTTKLSSYELRSYIENDIDIFSNLKSNIGLHASAFFTDNKSYYSLEPRVSLRYLYNNFSIKASYSYMNQYIHLLSNSGIGLPTDLWIPTTDIVKPEISQQVAFGISTLLFENEYEISFEWYYKKMKNLIEYREGVATFSFTGDWQNRITFGKGDSYGAEFFIKKSKGKTTGWLGYTLSWTNRKFEELNQGKEFPFKYDRRHDISLVLSHKLSDGFDVSLTWVYGTGNAISLPREQYIASNSFINSSYYPNFKQIEYYKNRNDFRMSAYHRLDLACRFLWGEDNSSILTVGVYNVYSRKNPFFYFLTNSYDSGEEKKVLKQLTLFPIIPSISYSFNF